MQNNEGMKYHAKLHDNETYHNDFLINESKSKQYALSIRV